MRAWNRLATTTAVLAALAVPSAALAGNYHSELKKQLHQAADEEREEIDRDGVAQFEGLAAIAASRDLRWEDLPEVWRTGCRSTGRHEEAYQTMLRLERELGQYGPVTREGNAAHYATAQVALYHARHELSEPRNHVHDWWDYLHVAEEALARIVEIDTDRDGLPDDRDDCPMQPEDKDGWQDDDGCPDPDNDGDGIPDRRDGCPNQPEDRDGYRDDDGCPDPDNDGDGIPDVRDRCPNAPETVNGIEDQDGCPDQLSPVFFEVDSARLDARSIATIQRNAELLFAMEGVRVRLEGHADAQASTGYNARLGERRARTVRDYMVNTIGISPARIELASFGESRPVADNSSREGRAMNRRVEFRVLGY